MKKECHYNLDGGMLYVCFAPFDEGLEGFATGGERDGGPLVPAEDEEGLEAEGPDAVYFVGMVAFGAELEGVGYVVLFFVGALEKGCGEGYEGLEAVVEEAEGVDERAHGGKFRFLEEGRGRLVFLEEIGDAVVLRRPRGDAAHEDAAHEEPPAVGGVVLL